MLSKIKHLKSTETINEEGYTLVEIMTVVVILGILALISIPIFTNQEKNSIEASIKSDLRNAALVLRTESTKSFGRTLSYVPNFATTSPDNRINLDTSASNAFYFCLVGTNVNVPSSVFYYSSKEGKVTTTSCPAIPNPTGTGSGSGSGSTPSSSYGNTSDSFDVKKQTQLANKKVDRKSVV